MCLLLPSQQRQQQEAYARALAAQVAEKDKEEMGGSRRRSARHENKENYIASPLNYEKSGFILPSPDPSDHVFNKHSPRRRSSLLQGMDLEAEEVRRQAQSQAEYARALDEQVMLFIDLIWQHLCHSTSFGYYFCALSIDLILQYLCDFNVLGTIVFEHFHPSLFDAM